MSLFKLSAGSVCVCVFHGRTRQSEKILKSSFPRNRSINRHIHAQMQKIFLCLSFPEPLGKYLYNKVQISIHKLALKMFPLKTNMKALSTKKLYVI